MREYKRLLIIRGIPLATLLSVWCTFLSQPAHICSKLEFFLLILYCHVNTLVGVFVIGPHRACNGHMATKVNLAVVGKNWLHMPIRHIDAENIHEDHVPWSMVREEVFSLKLSTSNSCDFLLTITWSRFSHPARDHRPWWIMPTNLDQSRVSFTQAAVSLFVDSVLRYY